MSLIVDPNTGDSERAEDIVRELMDLFKKHNCVLMVDRESGHITLARVIDQFRMQAKFMAQIVHITPRSYLMRPRTWGPWINESMNILGRREVS